MSQIYFFLGAIIDKIHIPAAVGTLGLGRLWLPSRAYLAILLLTITLQATLKDCPLNPLVVYLKRRHSPGFCPEPRKGLVKMTYERWPKAAPLIKLFFWQFFSLVALRIFS